MKLMETMVHRATDEEIEGLSAVVAGSLMAQPVGRWLVPDAAERPAALQRYAYFTLAHGLEHGAVFATDDHAAVAVWYSRLEPSPPSSVDVYELHRWLGPHAARFALLHSYVDAVLPYTPHHYLAHVAVRPGQGEAERALLASYHRVLDAEGLPAYAEVSSDRPQVGLLARFGYEPRSPILLERGGPALWRMWRPPSGGGPPGGLPRRVRLHRAATPFHGGVIPATPPGSP